MICKVCGKENLEDAKFCTACGSLLSDDFKACPSCGEKNSKEAKFCKACGKPLEVKNICPSCGLENKEVANYCKACGTPLNKKRTGNVAHLVFKIVSLCLCSFIILYCFAATFTNFMSSRGYGTTIMGLLDNADLNLFQVIKNISNVHDNSVVHNLGSYAMAGYLVPNIVMLFGILTAMIGCSVVLIIAVVRSIQTGIKRKLPNLECYSVLATGFLLVGLVIVGLNHLKLNASSFEGSISIGYSYGAVVLSAICIGIIWMLVYPIVQLVFRCIEGCSISEIRDRIFKMAEAILIIVLVFNVSINFAKIYVNHEEVNLVLQMSSLEYFNYAYCLAGFTKVFQESLSKEQIQSLVMSAILVAFMIACVIISLIFFIRRGAKKKEETPRASLCCGIVFMVMSILFLILSCIAAPMILKDVTYLDLIMGSSSEEITKILKTTISNNVIVFIVFSSALLALEIVWTVFNAKKGDSKERTIFNS
ncbi:MAG: zinc ribbon domain-containing protein [Anaeroplasmataceae bacterium]|nr:zinc ribbon domain-containing protein [Anaeroplasmataceae bacterium]